MPPPPAAGRGEVRVVDVWADNQEAELTRIRGLVRNFRIAAVDAPVVLDDDPMPASCCTLERRYEALRSRVESARSAQVGLALTNRHGEPALGGHVWRFHLGESETGAAEDEARRAAADPRRVCGALRECSRATMPSGMWVTRDGAEAVACLVRHAVCGGSLLPRRRDEFLRACDASFPELYDLRVLAEWATVSGGEPPLAGADAAGPGEASLFLRFLALARECNFRDRMVGYTGFLFGLGAMDNYVLVNFKKTAAEFEEKERQMMAFLAEGCDEECLKGLVLG